MITAAQATPLVADPASPPGLQQAFRVLLEHLGDHLALVTLESAQELSRLVSLTVSTLVMALLIQLSLALAATLTVALLWHTDYRLHAVLGCAVVLGLALAYAVWRLRRASAAASQRFVASRAQWQQDLILIRELL